MSNKSKYIKVNLERATHKRVSKIANKEDKKLGSFISTLVNSGLDALNGPDGSTRIVVKDGDNVLGSFDVPGTNGTIANLYKMNLAKVSSDDGGKIIFLEINPEA